MPSWLASQERRIAGTMRRSTDDDFYLCQNVVSAYILKIKLQGPLKLERQGNRLLKWQSMITGIAVYKSLGTGFLIVNHIKLDIKPVQDGLKRITIAAIRV